MHGDKGLPNLENSKGLFCYRIGQKRKEVFLNKLL